MATGWDNGINQDYSKKLGRWFASRPGARQQLREMYGGEMNLERCNGKYEKPEHGLGVSINRECTGCLRRVAGYPPGRWYFTQRTQLDSERPNKVHEERGMTKTEEVPKVSVTVCIAMSEGGTFLSAFANTNWVQEERKHRELLKRVREDTQLWSVKYIRTSITYPITSETQE